MVQDAHIKRMQAEKLLKETNSKVSAHVLLQLHRHNVAANIAH